MVTAKCMCTCSYSGEAKVSLDCRECFEEVNEINTICESIISPCVLHPRLGVPQIDTYKCTPPPPSPPPPLIDGRFVPPVIAALAVWDKGHSACSKGHSVYSLQQRHSAWSKGHSVYSLEQRTFCLEQRTYILYTVWNKGHSVYSLEQRTFCIQSGAKDILYSREQTALCI